MKIIKITNKIIFIFVFLNLLSFTSQAQSGYNSLTYNVASPSGETSGFIDQTSWRGVGIEVGKYIFRDKFSIGIGGNWNVFYKAIRGESVQYADTVTLTGSQFRYINALPIYVTGKYYFSTENKLVPFAGLGIGTAFVRNENNIGMLQLFSSGWQFALYPEVGLRYKAFSRADLLLSGRYNYGFETQKVPALSYFTVNLGLNFMY